MNKKLFLLPAGLLLLTLFSGVKIQNFNAVKANKLKIYAGYNEEEQTLYIAGEKTPEIENCGSNSIERDASDDRVFSNFKSNTKKVIFQNEIKPATLVCMFDGFTNLETIEGMEYLNTESATNMASAFSRCSSLVSLDLSHFNTALVTDFSNMFNGCSTIKSLDCSSFTNTGSLEMADEMFSNCANLEYINLKNLDFDNVEISGPDQFINGCANLLTFETPINNQHQFPLPGEGWHNLPQEPIANVIPPSTRTLLYTRAAVGIGNTYYRTLQEAFDACVDGDTILPCKILEEEASISKNIDFFIDDDFYSFDTNLIIPGDGYHMKAFPFMGYIITISNHLILLGEFEGGTVTGDLTTSNSLKWYENETTIELDGNVLNIGFDLYDYDCTPVANENYEFVKWTASLNGEESFDLNDETIIPADDIETNLVITPVFKYLLRDFTVTFDLNGKGNPIEPVTVQEGNTLSKPNDPTFDGFTFNGWYKEKDCINKWDFSADTVNADTILYASWSENLPPKEDKEDEDEDKTSIGGGKIAVICIAGTANVALIAYGIMYMLFRSNPEKYKALAKLFNLFK